MGWIWKLVLIFCLILIVDNVVFLKGDFPVNFDFNEFEIDSTKWISRDEVDEFIKVSEENGELITPWFRDITKLGLME